MVRPVRSYGVCSSLIKRSFSLLASIRLHDKGRPLRTAKEVHGQKASSYALQTEDDAVLLRHHAAEKDGFTVCLRS